MSELETAAAKALRNAVADFRGETLSLSSVEHLLRRIENTANALDTDLSCSNCGDPLGLSSMYCDDCCQGEAEDWYGWRDRLQAKRLARPCAVPVPEPQSIRAAADSISAAMAWFDSVQDEA